MFDMGVQELLLVGLVALIVLGPERLPQAARQAGKAFVKARKTLRNLKYAVRQAFEEEGPDE